MIQKRCPPHLLSPFPKTETTMEGAWLDVMNVVVVNVLSVRVEAEESAEEGHVVDQI